MPGDPIDEIHRDPDAEEERTTCQGDYRPIAPEVQSAASRVVVKIEISLMLVVIAALGVRFYLAHRPDHTPVRIASMRSIDVIAGAFSSGIGAGIESSGMDGADAGKGQVLYMQTCTACHGQRAQGMPHQGVSLRESRFIAGTNDRQLVAFLKSGRKPTDTKNSTGLLMPPRGGNPSLDDDSLGHIVAFLREVQRESGVAEIGSAASTKPVASAGQ